MPDPSVRADAGAARRREVLRCRRRPAGRHARRPAGLHPRAGRRERRRQVDAGQDRRRRPPARRAATFRFHGARRRLRIHGRGQGRRHRGDLPGADALPRPLGHREHLHGPPAGDARAVASTAPRCTPRRERLFARLGVHLDPRRPALGPVDRRPADHRDRQGHLARRLAADHGRADRGPQRASRSSGSSPSPAVPARRGPRPGLHLPPLRRGVRALRHGHGDARRRLRLHRRDRRHLRRRDRLAGWSDARSPSCSPRRRPRSATSCSTCRA